MTIHIEVGEVSVDDALVNKQDDLAEELVVLNNGQLSSRCLRDWSV